MKVSIITTCYNSSETILETIESVNTQNYENIEHVFIDGGSSDNTLELIKIYSKRISLIVSEKDEGIYDGMNKGILNAKGDIIIILNSDDVLYSNSIVEDLVNIFKANPNTGIVYGNIFLAEKNNIRKYIRKWEVSKFQRGCFKNGWHPPHPGFIVRKNIYEQYGSFDLKFKIASDFDLMMRLLEVHEIPSIKYDGIISILRYGGSSTNIKGIIKGAFEIKNSFLKNNINIFFPRIFSKDMWEKFYNFIINISMVQIIGGSGFVGSALIKTLTMNEVTNLDKRNSVFFPSITSIGDITNPDSINFKKDIDSIVLLAAEHRDDVSPTSLYYDVNVNGTKNVLKKMDEMGIRNLVFTSSVAVYGLNKTNPDELHQVDPFNHYGKSKWEAEKVIKEWYEKDPKGKSVTIIRPTVIFGERNRGNVYNLLKQISSGKFLMIGKGQNKKSMAYVGNIVAFIKDRIEKNELGYHIYNYADKPDFTMSVLSNLIEEKMNLSIPKTRIPYWLGMLGGYWFDLIAFLSQKKLSISSVRVKKFCATTQFDATKAHSVFDAPYTLEEGLKKTLEFEFMNPKEDDVLFYSE